MKQIQIELSKISKILNAASIGENLAEEYEELDSKLDNLSKSLRKSLKSIRQLDKSDKLDDKKIDRFESDFKDVINYLKSLSY